MNKPVYAIFGLGGLLGDAIYERLSETSEDYRIFAFDHARVDITKEHHVMPILEYVKPTVVINCAGVSAPEICEIAKEGAFSVNGLGPGIITKAATKVGAKVVQFSTWAVFDGKKKAPYEETDVCEPKSCYGQSKLEGERMVAACPNHLIIRPGWIFGEYGEGMIQQWIKNAERNLRVKVRTGNIGSPTYLNDLVEYMIELIDRDAKGTFHLCNDGVCSQEELAQSVLDACRLPGKPGLLPIEEKMLKAELPSYSAMSCEKYRLQTKKKPRHWKEALKECLFHMGLFKP